jgi:ankyrin repeat protein
MNSKDAPKPKRLSIRTEGPLGSWFTLQAFIFGLNEVHGDFRRVFFDQFRALLKENDEAYVGRLADYVRSILSMHMFVRVERPRGSKHFVLGYVKCERVFSFALRLEQMRLRLNRVPHRILRGAENGENKALRLAFVGKTDNEKKAEKAKYRRKKAPLSAALKAKDEDAAEALLDGGDDPNEVDGLGRNALHMAAQEGCRLPLFHRILGMIHNVNAVTTDMLGSTALVMAAYHNHLDMVVSLMNHRGIDVNVQNSFNNTALHLAVSHNRPAIVAQLVSDDRVDTSRKHKYNETPLKYAIRCGRHECAKILREHGAPEK